MSNLPHHAVTRTAKLATLPVGMAGRAALGLGKRLGGRPAEIVAQEIQQRTAEQIFRVLGELKGGALKLGQALSIFEAALPPEIAEPYRATLTRLQESAPPLPASTVHKVLAADLGKDWRASFREFDDAPAAAASIGQVHRATWQDGRAVAVKIQYPGAGKALSSDFTQLSRIGRLFGVLMPGLEMRPMLDELRARVVEELDYHLEAASQQAFADAYAGDPDIFIPQVVAGTDHVLVTEWMDGTPLAEIIAAGSQEQRDAAGLLLVRFLFAGPARCGLLHADPHPGNFRLLPDGRLGVLDFGAVDRLPDGLPPIFGRLMWLIHHDGDIEKVEQELRDNGFLRPGIHVDLAELHAFLAPLAEPSRDETFKFTREWLRDEAARVADIRPANAARRLNLPPSYVLIHRVSTAGIGVLCQLGCEGPFRAEVLRWIPGYGPTERDGEQPAPAASPELPVPELRVHDAPAIAELVGGTAPGRRATRRTRKAGGAAPAGAEPLKPAGRKAPAGSAGKGAAGKGAAGKGAAANGSAAAARAEAAAEGPAANIPTLDLTALDKAAPDPAKPRKAAARNATRRRAPQDKTAANQAVVATGDSAPTDGARQAGDSAPADTAKLAGAARADGGVTADDSALADNPAAADNSGLADTAPADTGPADTADTGPADTADTAPADDGASELVSEARP